MISDADDSTAKTLAGTGCVEKNWMEANMQMTGWKREKKMFNVDTLS